LESINNNKIKIKNKQIEEGLEKLDGVIFVKKYISLNLEKDCFMIDNPFKFGSFLGEDKKYSIKEFDLDLNKANNDINLSNVELKKKYFGFNRNKKSISSWKRNESENENKTQNFENIVKNLIRKAKIFKQIFEIEKRNIENIKFFCFMMLFIKKITMMN